MTTSVREKLSEGKLGLVAGISLIAVAAVIIVYYCWPAPRANALYLYYSDDDGASYFKDSVYKFPPFDHDGRQAVEARVLLDRGSKFVGYMIRYTPEAQKRLQDRYNEAVNNHMSSADIQHDILTFMHSPEILGRGQEAKLPGADNKWVPMSRFTTAAVKTPSGDLPEGAVFP